MGFLKRPQSPSPPHTESVPRVAVSVEDLAACASALGKMEEALLSSSDAGIRNSAREIAWAGGVRPSGDLLKWVIDIKLSDPDAKPLDRPWYWLAAVAEEATGRGDPRLSGRVGFFIHGWNEHIAPKMGVADGMDCGGIQNIPRAAYAKGLGFAVQALACLDASDIVVETSDKVISAGNLLAPLSEALLQLEQTHVAIDPDARNVALQAVA
jgi:hypothetical protein